MRKSKKRRTETLIKQGRLPPGSTGLKKSSNSTKPVNEFTPTPEEVDSSKLPKQVQEEWKPDSTNEKESIQVTESNELKIRRGMVFWFDLMPGFDKSEGSATFEVRGHTYYDRRLLGIRPWLVITDASYVRGTVLAIPFTTGNYFKEHDVMECSLDGKKSRLVLSMIQPVHMSQLTRYMTWMTDAFMDKVASAMMAYLGAGPGQVHAYTTKADALQRMESILDDVISAKVSDWVRPTITDDDLEGVMTRAMATFRTRCVEAVTKVSQDMGFPVPAVKSPVTEVDKFYNRYPDLWPQGVMASKGEPEVTAPAPVPAPEVPDEIPLVKGSFISKKPTISKSVPPFFDADGILDYGMTTEGKPAKRMRWDEKYASLFFYDCETRPMEEVLKAWRIKNATALSSTKTMLRKEYPSLIKK